MKILLAFITLTIATFAAEPLRFVVVTTETVWPDGRGCSVGEIEVVIGEDEGTFQLWAENGKRYPINKASVRLISAEDAALMLIQARQKMYQDIHALEDAAASASIASVPVETARDRMRARKADRDAKARQSQEDFLRWKMLQFFSR